MEKKPFSSRRSFLKALSAIAVVPLTGTRVFAQETTATAAATTAPLTFKTTPTATLQPQTPGSLHRIMTANILLASSAHNGTPLQWSLRREQVVRVLRAHKPDIICTQEVLREQYEYLVEEMPEFDHFGFAGPEMDVRPAGYQGVTKNVIFFSGKRYEMTSAGTYWLSETPLIAASQSWDALRARHANWVRLKDKETGHEFRVIDAHLDHKGQLARVEQTKLITAEAAQYTPEFPQLLAGDFNVDMKSPAYKVVVDAGWSDTYLAVHGHDDPGHTYHNMKGPAYKAKTGKIDFIFSRGKVETKSSNIIMDNENGSYPSDHYFLIAEVIL